MCDGVAAEVRAKFAGAKCVRFSDKPLDLGRVARECDLAVLNAGHGATAGMLRAGVPALLVPIHLEQGLLARAAVGNTGACVAASCKDAEQLVRRLNEMLEPHNFERCTAAARRFAQKHAAFDPAEQVGRMVGRVEELIGQRRPTRDAAKVFAG